MKLTVCIPSYNLAEFIGKTIESVQAQTFKDWELLIEDDGSTDDSVTVIEKYLADSRISLFKKEKNEGQNRTTNNLIHRAKGEYICLLPADDVIVPDKFQKQIDYLDSHLECGIVFGYPDFMDHNDNPIRFVDETVKTVENMPKESWQKRFMVGNCLFIATSMYRRELHEKLGYIDESYNILADLDWYCRIVAENELHIIKETLAHVRMRDKLANLSAPRPEVCINHADEIKLLREKHMPVVRGKKKYMIATPFYEVKGYSPYIRSMINTLVGLAKHTKVEFDFVELSGDSYVWRARNKLADMFLKSDCSHLIFVDSDEGWDPEGFYRLMKAEAPIVGAAYPVKNNWEHYGVAIDVNEDGTPKVRDDGLIYASKVPTGFMKISRHVFERLKDAEPDNWYWEPDEYSTMNRTFNYFGHIMEDHVIYGEDISFCRRWQRIGGELFVEPRATIEHWGAQCWKGNYHEFLCTMPGGSKDPALKEAA